MKTVLTSRALVAIVALALFATACSSDPTEVVIGVADDDTAANDDVVVPVAEDSPPEIETTTTTTGPPRSTTTHTAPATTTLPTQEYLETLGPAMIGIGEWVVLRPSGDGDDECPDGVLAYQVDGEVVHTYDKVSFAGGIRLFNGTKGQDAFVLNCEESVVGLLLQTSSVFPDGGYPDLQEIDFFDDLADQEPSFFFSDEWGWSNDVFVGWGSLGGASGLWAFGIPDAPAVLLSDLLGERAPTNTDLGVSVVVPRDWTHESTSDGELVTHPFSSSRVQVWSTPGSLEPPLAEGDELLSSDVVSTRIWSAADAGTAPEPGYPIEVDEWTFLNDDGVRVVRYIGRGSETVVIELFADGGDGSIDQDLPWLVLDTLRVFENG